MTFNYTETLEILYGVKNVCHIHGKQGGELLFGHGNHGPYNYYTNNFIGSEDVIQQIYEKLRKDTATAIKKNKHFFANIDSTISKVYSYGFSFSEIDNLYIEHISKKLTNPNVVWYLNTHNNYKQRQNYKNIIRKSGYKGRFDTYSIRA